MSAARVDYPLNDPADDEAPERLLAKQLATDGAWSSVFRERRRVDL